jgi:dsDNA-specific endonuclease/ATPase MutS2
MAPGDSVQTPLGKGIVREVRKNGRVVVDVRGRAVLFPAVDVAPVDERKRRAPRPAGSVHATERSGVPGAVRGPSEIDLHGLTVSEAIGRAEEALNLALLADRPELRVIHGQSGGRIREALHRWLKGIASVRGFHVDPRNAGVTVVRL